MNKFIPQSEVIKCPEYEDWVVRTEWLGRRLGYWGDLENHSKLQEYRGILSNMWKILCGRGRKIG